MTGYHADDAPSVDALADELLGAIRDHPANLIGVGSDPALLAAYNRLWCELHDKVPAVVVVIARCVGCKATKEVGPDEGQPFCDKCGSVMVAESARASSVACSDTP